MHNLNVLDKPLQKQNTVNDTIYGYNWDAGIFKGGVYSHRYTELSGIVC